MNSAIERAASCMSGFAGAWGFAGGWAIDLFVGQESRLHSDIDIAILRDDQRELRSRLPAEGVAKVVMHSLLPWSSEEALLPPIHEVHVTWPDGYHLEFLLNERDRRTQEWVFRRDARVHRPIAATFAATAHGLPYLAPEIVLLYKSKAASPKDDADLATALPLLDAEQRLWLRDALHLAMPGHRWSEILVQKP